MFMDDGVTAGGTPTPTRLQGRGGQTPPPSYAGKKVLVTGGYGFVGSHLTADLLQAGADVTVLDLDCSAERPSRLNAEGLRDSVSLVEGDVADEDTLSSLFGKTRFDHVFHLAAISVIEKSALNPRACLRTNVVGVVTLLDGIARHAGQDPESIVLASTDKVYGESGTELTDETSPLRGRGFYEAGKCAGDVLARTYHEMVDLPTRVIRPCNLFGPHDYGGRQTRLIPRALSFIYSSSTPQPPVLYLGSVAHRRDYLYIGDASRAFMTVGTTPGVDGEAFNLCGCVNVTTPHMLGALVEAASKYEEQFDHDRAEQILSNGIKFSVGPSASRAVVIEEQRIDGRKIAEHAGFRPEVELKDGLERTVAAYREFFHKAD